MASNLKFLGLAVGTAANDRGPRIQVVTPGGVIREIPLTRHDLVRIVQGAGAALESLDKKGR